MEVKKTSVIHGSCAPTVFKISCFPTKSIILCLRLVFAQAQCWFRNGPVVLALEF